MVLNDDGSVTLKTPGKTAQSPSGSGTGQVKPVTAKSSTPGPRVVKQKGRGPVGKTQSSGKSGAGSKGKSAGKSK
jgi:hypothetical protein